MLAKIKVTIFIFFYALLIQAQSKSVKTKPKINSSKKQNVSDVKQRKSGTIATIITVPSTISTKKNGIRTKNAAKNIIEKVSKGNKIVEKTKLVSKYKDTKAATIKKDTIQVAIGKNLNQLPEKVKVRDSTFYNIMHYKLPDSTKLFFNQLMHPSKRDSIYWQETDVVDLFVYTFSSKKVAPKVKIKPRKIYWSFLPSASPSAKNAIVTATNAAFYLGLEKNTNISNFNFLAFYNWFGQFTFPIRANVWTARNKFNLQGDYRFYHYPLPTYGIGDDSKSSDRNLVTYNYFRFYQYVLRRVDNYVFLGAGYAYDYHFKIRSEDPQSGGGQDMTSYKEGTEGSSLSSGITLNALFDNRANSINPQKGTYLNAIFRVNWRALGSDNNWQSVYLDARKYISLSKKKNKILCFWGLAWFTVSGSPPYLSLPSTGWDSYSTTARGYIQGRFTGKNMLYFETEYRFNLMRNGLLGAVVFGNLTAFPTPNNISTMRLLPALGTGLRIKINKYSRTNFAFDVAHGLEDSWGFWLTIGEMF